MIPAEVIANFLPLLGGSTLARTFCTAPWQTDLRSSSDSSSRGCAHSVFHRILFHSFRLPSFSQCLISAWKRDRKVICLRTASKSVTKYWLNAIEEERRCWEASQDLGRFQTDLLCLVVALVIYHCQQLQLRDNSRGAQCQPADLAHGAPRKCSLYFYAESLSV